MFVCTVDSRRERWTTSTLTVEHEWERERESDDQVTSTQLIHGTIKCDQGELWSHGSGHLHRYLDIIRLDVSEGVSLRKVCVLLNRLVLILYQISGGVLSSYQKKVESKELDVDEYQERVAKSLQSLSDELSNYSPQSTGSNLFSKVSYLFSKEIYFFQKKYICSQK